MEEQQQGAEQQALPEENTENTSSPSSARSHKQQAQDDSNSSLPGADSNKDVSKSAPKAAAVVCSTIEAQAEDTATAAAEVHAEISAETGESTGPSAQASAAATTVLKPPIITSPVVASTWPSSSATAAHSGKATVHLPPVSKPMGMGLGNVPRSSVLGGVGPPPFVNKAEDYRRFYYYVQYRLQKNRQPLEELHMAHNEVIDELECAPEKGGLEQREYFLRRVLPDWVDALLKRKSHFYRDHGLRLVVNDFLHSALRLAVKMVPFDMEEHLLMVSRILSVSHAIYKRAPNEEDRSVMRFRNTRDKERDRALKELLVVVLGRQEEEDEHQLQRYSSLSSLRRQRADCDKYDILYFANVNFFGYIGGFQALWDRVARLAPDRAAGRTGISL
jgi:hypothetical protein